MVTQTKNSHRPFLGFGLGLRHQHYQAILETNPAIDWFEILTENYLAPGGKPLYFLDQIAAQYPVVMHGVSLSIGSSDPLNWDYLKRVKQLADRINPAWISDHLCWTGVDGKNMHDLLPLPYTEETLNHIIPRVKQVQDYLERPFLLENVSSYLTYQASNMTEWEFITSIANASNCLLLLDVNNVYVSSVNHEFDPMEYINAVPPEKVYQIHLAGHSNCGDYLIDTHDATIIDPVWDLYAKTITKLGKVSTMIERDDHIPPLEDLLKELNQARDIAETIWVN